MIGEQEDTVRRRTIASALLVGGSVTFGGRCRESLERVGVTVWSCGLESFKSVLKQHAPALVVATEAIIAADSMAFGEAQMNGVRIVRVSREDISQPELEALLMAAFREAMRENGWS
jgi:hypothetical protein